MSHPASAPRAAWLRACLVLLSLLAVQPTSVLWAKSAPPSSVHDFTMTDIDGKPAPLSRYQGKVMLVVNVASKCGLTPQYKELQTLHEKYQAKGLRIVGFPANNFKGQEPGTDAEIKKFCDTNYKVSFDLMSKISVKEPDQSPLYTYLTKQSKFPGEIQWNFEKFLVGPDGKVVARFAPRVKPDSPEVIKAIEQELAKLPAQSPEAKQPQPAPADKAAPKAKPAGDKAAPAHQHDHSKPADKAAPATDKAAEPAALKEYMGRPIAQTMHWTGADWLERTTREREEATSVMIAQLKVQQGWKVADVGCGSGYHSLMLSKLVGDTGKVYAVDIQQEMLDMLAKAATKQQAGNIVPVLGTLTDPKLPEGELHLVLLVDAYHEFSHPVHMLKAIRQSLRPDGRLVLVEFRAEDNTVPIKPEHKMSKAQIEKELTANGFKLADSFDGLPWQHMVFYQPG